MRLAETMPAILLALAYLLPGHGLPWSGLYGDLFAAACLALLVWRHGMASGVWPLPALAVLALSLLPWLQLAGGLLLFRGDALMAWLYLVGLALAIKIGAQERLDDELRRIGAAVLAAALVSAAIALLVTSGLLGEPGWLAPQARSGRASAQLAQPNLLASLLVLGLLALLATWPRGALAGGLLLVTGVALTQSRSGLLQAVVLLTAAAWAGPRWGLLASRRVVFVLATGLVLAMALTQWHTESGAARPHLGDLSSVQSRLGFLQLFGAAVWAEPWTGYGFNQVSIAQARQMLVMSSPPEWAEYSHNLALDLLLWCGLPIGGMIVAGLAVLLWRCARARAPDRSPAELGVALLLIHAMLEYPLAYFVFLLPFGLMLGRLWREARPMGSVAVGPGLTAGLAVLAILALVLMLGDYRRIAPELAAVREAHRRQIALVIPAGRPALVLSQLDAQLMLSRYALQGAGPDVELSTIELASERFAYLPVLHRLTRDATERGEAARADRARRRLCALLKAGSCTTLPPPESGM